MAIFILPTSGLPDVIVFDVIKAYSDNAQAIVTVHPVEVGSNPADHIRPEPRIITLTGFVTNTPISPVGGRGEVVQIDVADFGIPTWEAPFDYTPGAVFREAGALIGDAVGAIGDAIFGPPTPPTVQVLAFNEPFNRILEMETLLDKVRTLGILSTIVTAERQFPSMALTSIEQRKLSPYAADFDLVFQTLTTVSTLTVDAPKPAELRGAPGANAGQQPTAPVGTKDAVKAQSALFKMTYGS
jgi:hypothetical protein